MTPSAPLVGKLRSLFREGVRTIREMGYVPVLSANALKVGGVSAGTPEERADDMNAMFADESISAVFTSQGGSTSNACLPLLDWKLIKSNPKIFLGMSDVTVLLNSIYERTGLVTFHAVPVFWLSKLTGYERAEFSDRLEKGRAGPVKQSRPRKTVRRGKGEGTLLGGNLSRVLLLAGTPYWPDFSGSILFLESFHEDSGDIEAAFTQLKQAKVFDKVEGVLLGHAHTIQSSRSRVTQMEDLLLEATADYTFPILKTDDFGHWCQNTVLPVGGKVRIDSGRKAVELTEPCVE